VIESGPAAGVVAAAQVARAGAYANVITLDMGGTTTKASIIEHGELLRAGEYEVGSEMSVSSKLGRGSGYLLRIPVIDISEVGAGGGSLARIDEAGALRGFVQDKNTGQRLDKCLIQLKKSLMAG
jgi:N-methylhydantoinase A